MSLILFALTLFAVVLMMAHLRNRVAIAVWLGVLAFGLYVLPGHAKVAVPLATILTLGLAESLSGLRTGG